jgi:PAS domain S-box-containing protein
MQVEEGAVSTPVGAIESERLDAESEVDFDRAARFRDFFGDLPLGVALIEGPEARLNNGNHRLHDILVRSDLSAVTIFDLIDRDAEPDAAKALAAAAAGAIPHARVVAHVLRGDGRRVRMLIVIGIVGGPSANPFRSICYFVDQTEQERQEHRANRFFELSMDMIATGTLGGYLIDVNPAWQRTLGWARDELTTLPLMDLVHDDDRVPTQAAVAELTNGVVTVTFENRCRARDGSYHWLLWSASHDVEESVIYYVGKDVTRSREAAEQLRVNEDTLRGLVDANVIGVITVDLDGHVLSANDAFCAMVGWTQDEVRAGLVGPATTRPPEWDGATAGAIAEVIATGAATRIEKEYVHKDGHRIPVLIGGSMVDAASLRCACFVLDLTDRKRAEADQRELNILLEHRIAERTAELEAFTYSVSHDLRAPLRAMTGFANLLIAEVATTLSDEQHHYLDRIISNAERMGLLIDDLLRYSRLGRQALRVTDVSPRLLVETIFQDLAAELAARDVRLVWDDLPDCSGDPELVGLIFQNLIANAVKFTGERETARITITGSNGSGVVTYHVADNGVGFDPRYADKLFEVFQRLHAADRFEGTGVGLAIVKRAVERHGGTVSAESRPGEGATFTFTLPVRPNA